MAKIKICGLMRQQDIEYVNELKPDYVGFILSPGFRRSITKELAAVLKSKLDKNIKTVGVFVDDSLDNISYFIDNDIIDIVQLHGDESCEYCNMINAPVIKYFKPDDFNKAEKYETDYFLFDSGTGTGKTFEWSEIPKIQKPFFLAGGLDENNIKKAVEKVKPYAVDMSSSVETNGVKDYNKIKRIIDIVRSTQ